MRGGGDGTGFAAGMLGLIVIFVIIIVIVFVVVLPKKENFIPTPSPEQDEKYVTPAGNVITY